MLMEKQNISLKAKQIDNCVMTCLNHKGLTKDHMGQARSQPCC